MSFRPPMNEAQLKTAKLAYLRMRSNLRLLGKNHPAQTANEQGILHSYKIYVRSFGKELLKPLRAIDADRLNDLENRAVSNFVIYMGIWKRPK